MRMMVRFHFSPDTGNDVVRSGKINEVFGKIMADLKPEAAYLYPEQGERGGIFVFDMQDSTWVAGVVERFSFGLKAKIEMIPVMTPDDLQKGLANISDIVKNFG